MFDDSGIELAHDPKANGTYGHRYRCLRRDCSGIDQRQWFPSSSRARWEDIELAAFKEPSYTLFAVGIFLTFWGVYFVFYYLSSFGVDIIHIPQSESLNMILILSGVGIIGRIAPGYVADRYVGPMNVLPLVTVASIVCTFAMIGVTSEEGFTPGRWFIGLWEMLFKGCFRLRLVA